MHVAVDVILKPSNILKVAIEGGEQKDHLAFTLVTLIRLQTIIKILL